MTVAGFQCGMGAYCWVLGCSGRLLSDLCRLVAAELLYKKRRGIGSIPLLLFWCISFVAYNWQKKAKCQ